MSDRDTLPLPEPEALGIDFDKGWDGVHAYGYTEAQMLAHREEYAAARVAQAVAQERARAIPAGWRLVPEEATQEMTEIGAGVIDDNGGNARWSDIREAWAGMIAAAPQPPSEPPPSAGEEKADSGRNGE